MGIFPDGVGGGGGGPGRTEDGAARGEQSTEKGVGWARTERAGVRQLEHGLECFICQPCLVDPLGCCVPGLQIGVCRSSKGHSGDLTLDIQFESAAEFDHQGPGVRVSGIQDQD